MEQISGSDLLGIRSHAAMADDYTTICRNNTDRLTQAYLALQVENVRLRDALTALLTGDVGQQTMAKLGTGQATDTDDGRAWLRAAAMVTPNAEVIRSAPLLAQVGSTAGLCIGAQDDHQT